MTISPDRHFSQNFLHDPYLIDKLIQFIRPQKNDVVVEIGPGKGALTSRLAGRVQQLSAVEIDHRLVQYLNNLSLPDTHIISGDILTQTWPTLLAPLPQQTERTRLVGNLPYHLSSDILQLCVYHASLLEDIHVMLQREVAERLIATSGKAYGRLSLFIRMHFDIQILMTLSPEDFDPAPRVHSSFIRLIPKKHLPLFSIQTLSHITALAFQQRRKQISNSLQPLFSKEELLALNISPQSRPENISDHHFFSLCLYYEQRRNTADNKQQKAPLPHGTYANAHQTRAVPSGDQ